MSWATPIPNHSAWGTRVHSRDPEGTKTAFAAGAAAAMALQHASSNMTERPSTPLMWHPGRKHGRPMSSPSGARRPQLLVHRQGDQNPAGSMWVPSGPLHGGYRDPTSVFSPTGSKAPFRFGQEALSSPTSCRTSPKKQRPMLHATSEAQMLSHSLVVPTSPLNAVHGLVHRSSSVEMSARMASGISSVPKRAIFRDVCQNSVFGDSGPLEREQTDSILEIGRRKNNPLSIQEEFPSTPLVTPHLFANPARDVSGLQGLDALAAGGSGTNGEMHPTTFAVED